MRHRKPLILRIFIRICVVFMVISLIGIYVGSMFKQDTAENNIDENTGDIQEITGDVQIIEEVLPEVNPDEPENTAAPILITEDGEINEMDQLREIKLENGETELVREGDLGDFIQVNQ